MIVLFCRLAFGVGSWAVVFLCDWRIVTVLVSRVCRNRFILPLFTGN
ncbi:MAG: hypothetical protein LBP59_15650 [Planctomycetaceae bacterium]|nr:hypothetical protein [Planctomycetaceae bacterium]